MAMQQVEYEFPDTDSKSTAVTVDLEEKEDNGLEVEGAVGREDMKVPAKESKSEELEIEIEDDTPEADRGRKPRKPPEEVTEGELKDYSDVVKNRIKNLSRGIHDERRAKETALREREELENYARNLMSENNKLKGTVDTNHNTLIQSAKKQVEGEMAIAKGRYKTAYESGETDAILDRVMLAHTKITSSTLSLSSSGIPCGPCGATCRSARASSRNRNYRAGSGRAL